MAYFKAIVFGQVITNWKLARIATKRIQKESIKNLLSKILSELYIPAFNCFSK